MENQELDYILVPLGLSVMVAYHLWLLRRVVRHPTKTVIGINAINRRIWVRTMMQDPARNGVLAVQTLRNNIMASTLLASTAITLCSLIVVLMTNGGARGCGGGGDGGGQVVRGQDFVVLGDRSDLGRSIKLFAILLCFLLAFLFNVQAIRYYSHAGVLINVPLNGWRPGPCMAAVYVGQALNRGGYFWSVGLRAFYFSIPLFLWVFGPIPMIASSLALVCMFYFLDVNSSWGEMYEEDDDEEKMEMMHVGS